MTMRNARTALECGYTSVLSGAAAKPRLDIVIRNEINADLLLVDGDPLADIKCLQNRDALLAIMKDGSLHKAPTFA